MTQNSEEFKKREKVLKAIMYIAVFLMVFVVLSIGEADYDNPLGIAIYCLGTTLIFQFIVLDYIPPADTKKIIFIIGIATVLGLIVASRSINILSILASAGGVVGAVMCYQLLSKRSESAKA